MKKIKILPSQIGLYRLKKQFSGEEFEGQYALGIYSDLDGKIVFAKRWDGSVKTLAYQWLKNEAQVYQKLHSNRRGQLLVPQYIDLVEDNQSLTLITEYVDGINLQSIETKRKALIYENMLRSLLKFKIEGLKVARPPIYWITISLFISILAFIRHSSAWIDILRGLQSIMLGSKSLLARKNRSFVHRDLNDNNVIVKDDQIYLIDFELAIIADPLIDVAILILKNNNNKQFIKDFMNTSYVKTIVTDAIELSVTRSYISIFSLYDLCYSNGLHANSLSHLRSL